MSASCSNKMIKCIVPPLTMKAVVPLIGCPKVRLIRGIQYKYLRYLIANLKFRVAFFRC